MSNEKESDLVRAAKILADSLQCSESTGTVGDALYSIADGLRRVADAIIRHSNDRRSMGK